jgi:hypothetical protein
MIEKWHTLLGMEKHDLAWYESDLEDELTEYRNEQKLIAKWSELSDVVYVCTRAKWSGTYIPFPFTRAVLYLGALYMIPKYTGRWLFFRTAGKKSRARNTIREVRNPKKIHKLHLIAHENGINAQAFQEICEKQLKYWPLLP